jgi:arsenate reductase
MEIWHNPRCSKSRQTLALIEERGGEPAVRRYLDEPPSAAELERALTALGLEPWEITRMGEDRARELGLADRERDRGAWIELLAANPILIERPIVIADDGRAILGRPPERVRDLLGD